jgi:hypothetical protein
MKRIDGKLIANASTRLRFAVEAQDIRNGKPLNPNACAIAVACKRQVEGVTNAFVHLGTLYVEFGKRGWFRWTVPEYATREIVAFDRGGTFVPTEIDFRPISTAALVQKVKRIRSRGSAPTRKRQRKPPDRHYTTGVRGPAYSNEPPAPPKSRS